MSRGLRVAAAIAVLATLGIYSAFPHPTYHRATLKAVAAESRQLMATYPISPSDQFADVPEDKWPPTIASLKPELVTVSRGMVNISIKPFFDGGWGYGFALDERKLGMFPECWSELGHGVYWHGPC